MLRAEKILVPARVAFGNLLGCMADPWLLTDPSATGVLAAVLSIPPPPPLILSLSQPVDNPFCT